MTFIESIKTCFSKYATVEGRASRSEFWDFFIFYLILSGAGSVGHFVQAVSFLPLLAVAARRLHDRGLFGGWPFIIIVITFACAVVGAASDSLILFISFAIICGGWLWLFIVLCLPTIPEKNEYGLPPGDVAVKTAEESTD